MIDRTTIDRILDAARIEEVISDFVALKRRGTNYVACCPFHHEKTPSFSVSPTKGIYKCFGCGKAGSVVTFVMEHEQMSYVEALKYLGRKYGIEVKEKEETAQDIQERLYHESLLIVNDFAQKFYTKTLWESPEGQAVGLSYFRERGFTDETIRKFLLGYAPNERRAFTHQAQKAGYKKEHLTAVGLTIERENSGELFDRFYERVLFPIRSISGKVIAFGGRKLRNDNKEIAKYINSPESEVYVKNRSLYGIFEAKASIVREQKCYLVEGYTDVISFHQAGVENVVASSGTSLTTGQIGLIKRFTNKVTVLYDGDFAGIKASLRGIDMLLEEGLEVKVALFPDGEDPDSYARSHSREEIRDFLQEQEEDFIEFKYKILSKDIQRDPIQRARLIAEVISSIAVIPDAIVRSVYIEETSARLNIGEDLLQQEVAKIRKKKQTDAYYNRLREEKIAAANSVNGLSGGYMGIPAGRKKGAFSGPPSVRPGNGLSGNSGNSLSGESGHASGGYNNDPSTNRFGSDPSGNEDENNSAANNYGNMPSGNEDENNSAENFFGAGLSGNNYENDFPGNRGKGGPERSKSENNPATNNYGNKPSGNEYENNSAAGDSGPDAPGSIYGNDSSGNRGNYVNGYRQDVPGTDGISGAGRTGENAGLFQLPNFVVNTYCEEAEKEILYYLLKFGHLPIHLEEQFIYGTPPEKEQTVAGYILEQLRNDDLELQNLVYKNIFDEYFRLEETQEDKILRHFVNHPDPSVSGVALDLMIQPYTLTIKQFTKAIIPEKNVLGKVVPKSILLYKAKVTAQAAMNLTEELGKAQKEHDLEKQRELMEQLNTLMQVRNVFSKALNRITF